MFNYLVPWQLGGPLERFKSQPCWHYLPRTHPYNAILGTVRCQSRVGASLTKLCRDLGRCRNGMRHCQSNCQLLQLLLQLQACCGCNYVNYGNAKFKLQVARGNVASRKRRASNVSKQSNAVFGASRQPSPLFSSRSRRRRRRSHLTCQTLDAGQQQRLQQQQQ